ncbi:MAG TPA: hypothetical protein GX717_07180, partial [Clostridiaceae bacterium]|nr:hypothetical protein [Clostridiaceae bacterium]
MGHKNTSVMIVATYEGNKIANTIKQKKPSLKTPLIRLITLFKRANIQDICVVAPKDLENDIKRGTEGFNITFIFPATEDINNTMDVFNLQRYAFKNHHFKKERLFITTDNTPFFRLETIELLLKAKNLPAAPSYDYVGG